MNSSIDLESVEYFAGLQFTDEELAIILEVNVADLRLELKENTTIRARTIHRGRLLREARLRDVELTMAEAGSSPALAAARAMINRRS